MTLDSLRKRLLIDKKNKFVETNRSSDSTQILLKTILWTGDRPSSRRREAN